MIFFLRVIFAGLGGLAFWAAHAPMSWWPLLVLAFTFLWVSVYHASVKWGFLLGLIWGLFFFLPHTAWAAIAAGTVFALVALALSQALFIAIVGGIWSQISYLSPKSAWLWAAISWCGIEHVRGELPFGGMPWGKVAFALNDSPLARLAPLGSTLLVGLVAVAISILFAQALVAMPRSFFTMATSLALACALFVLPLFLPLGGSPEGQIAVGIVQGGSPTKEEVPRGYERALRVTQNHVELAQQVGDADLIVMPESTSDRDMRTDPVTGGLLRDLAVNLDTPLMFGTQEYLENGRYNDYLVMAPDSSIIGRYSKQHPVPFGEYVPFRDAIESSSQWLAQIINQISVDMLAGTTNAHLDVPTSRGQVRLATPICFEIAYDLLVSQAVTGSGPAAQLIVVPTNNASFGDSGEPYQQFEMTRFRAMEFGRSAIQVSTTGVSGLVEANGVLRYRTDVGQQEARTENVMLYNHLTFAARSADVRHQVGYGLAIIAVIIAIIAYRRRTHKARRR